MITAEDLRSIFSIEQQNEPETIVYRKYTNDTVPSQVLQLSNLSDSVYIDVYAELPEYANIVESITSARISATEGIRLSPLETTTVVVGFYPEKMNTTTDSTPLISFDIQALEEVLPDEVGTPMNTPTQTPVVTRIRRTSPLEVQ